MEAYSVPADLDFDCGYGRRVCGYNTVRLEF
jgi:hypothetical protein